MRIRTILVPTDFGPSSRAAWNYAQEIAIRFNSKLHVVHVLTPPPFVEDPLGADRLAMQLADLLKESARDVERALSRLVARPALERRVVRRMVTGKPVDEILRYVRAHRIDLVVMGTHGRGPIKHVLLGSVAERVVRHCPVPVVTLHGSGGRR